MNRPLSDYTFEELKELVSSHGEPAYRAKQLYARVSAASPYPDMTDLPASFREKLESQHPVTGVEIVKKITAKDGTSKYLFALSDGDAVEGVFMRYSYGNTLCVSTQCGCRMNCAFCASGADGLARNLLAGEILGQVLEVNRLEGGTRDRRAVDNVVLMGSGEPLDNYDNVSRFLNMVSAPGGICIGRRNVSLSTCGLIDGIRKLADDGFTPTLSVSLHAPDDVSRRKIMPTAKKWSVKGILDAAQYYFEKTGRRYIIEYALIKGVNDGDDAACKLAELLKGRPCHVNLIRLNPVEGKNLLPSDRVRRFMDLLTERGISVTARRRTGADLDGACGQLRRRSVRG